MRTWRCSPRWRTRNGRADYLPSELLTRSRKCRFSAWNDALADGPGAPRLANREAVASFRLFCHRRLRCLKSLSAIDVLAIYQRIVSDGHEMVAGEDHHDAGDLWAHPPTACLMTTREKEGAPVSGN
jgi:hypothetical protein